MAIKPDDNEPKRLRMPATANTSVSATQTLETKKKPPRTGIHPSFLKFAAALFEIGDATKAYYVTHPRCKSARQAKERGRALCQLPEIQLELRRLRAQAIDGTGENGTSVGNRSDAEKIDWENEVRLLAYSKVELRKVPVKEKLAALRLFGESRNYLKQSPGAGTGIRATFIFRMADGKTFPNLGSRSRDEAITVAVETNQNEEGLRAPEEDNLAASGGGGREQNTEDPNKFD